MEIKLCVPGLVADFIIWNLLIFTQLKTDGERGCWEQCCGQAGAHPAALEPVCPAVPPGLLLAAGDTEHFLELVSVYRSV